MRLPSETKQALRRGHAFSTATLLAATMALAASPARAQQAYFSFEGNIAAAGGQHEFTFNLPSNQADTDDLFFQTYSGVGGTNLAGDTITVGVNPRLDFVKTDGSLGVWDDSNATIDARIDFGDDLDSGHVLPDPLLAGDYRLTHSTRDNNRVGTWALDLAAPAGNFILTGLSPVNSSTVTSLKFGTTGTGANSAVFNNTGATTVSGLVTVESGGVLNASTGTSTFYANGGVLVDGGAAIIQRDNFSIADGTTFEATNGAQVSAINTINDPDDLDASVDTLFYFVSTGISTASVTYNINAGADFATPGGLLIGLGGNGTFIVDGVGSSLSVGATTNNAISELGSLGNGNLTVRNGATADYFSNFLWLGRLASASNTTTLSVESGATFTAKDIKASASNAESEAGAVVINVTGAGSTLTQFNRSWVALTLGSTSSTSTNTTTVNVTNNGVFTTGAGATTLNRTATLNIDTRGVFNANGDVNVNGGDLNRIDGVFNLADGKKLTASNNGTVDFTGFYIINGGSTFEINSGADFTVSHFLDVANNLSSTDGDGTLIVDGVGSTLTTNTSRNVALDWGRVNTAQVTVRNGASATIQSGAALRLAKFGGSTSSASLTIDSGFFRLPTTFSANTIEVASSTGGGTASITVTGTGASLTQSGASTLTIGAPASTSGTSASLNQSGASALTTVVPGTGTVTVTNGGRLTTGTGTTTVNTNGTLNVEATWNNSLFNFNVGRLLLNGNLVIEDGGELAGNGGIDEGTTTGATITNRGTLRTARDVVFPFPGSSLSRSFATEINVAYTQAASGVMTFGVADMVGGSGDDVLTQVFINEDYTLAGQVRFLAEDTGDPLTDLGFLGLYSEQGLIQNSSSASPTRTGVFDTVAGHILGDGTAIAVLYDGAEVNAQRVYFGDADLDGVIDQSDLDIVVDNWLKNNLTDSLADISWASGDFTGDGLVSWADLDAVLLNWEGDTDPVLPPGIPEPASLALLGLGGLCLLGRRRTSQPNSTT